MCGHAIIAHMPTDSSARYTQTYLVLVSVAALVVGLVIGLWIGVSSPQSVPVLSQLAADKQMPEGVDFSPVWQTWHTIDEKFVPASVSSTTKPATTEDRVYGMAQGLAASLGDPYTIFFPPVESQAFQEDISGAFEGVGMEIENRNEILTVVSPLKGTPAFRAGIKAGDLILQIDGKETKGMQVQEAVKKIRGPHGTKVKLLIYREGFDKPKEFDITRDVINIPTIDTKVLNDGTYYIQLMSFNAQSAELFRKELRAFYQTGNNRLILDLRGNPGGYLESAVSIASWFLPLGKEVVTEDYGGNQPSIVHRSLGYNVFAGRDLKMVILVDKGSASASEILAGALQQHGIAKLVGTNTFGKGSVQELLPVTSDTSLKVTVARWLEPDGTHIPTEGIKPDIMASTTDAEVKAGKDTQLEKAQQIIKSM